jgi:galactokinase
MSHAIHESAHQGAIVTRFVGQLHSAGMNPADAHARSALFEDLLRELRALRDGSLDRSCAFFVPGRIEVLGKHTDYAGGRSLLCAVERGICVVAAPRADAQIHVIDAARNLETRFAFEPHQEISSGHWSSYAVTVARRIARDFPKARTGAEIIFSSDLPRASGISSSSALIIAIFSALAEINSLSQMDLYQRAIRTCEDLASYLAAVENGFEFGSFSSDSGVGTLGGSEDHTAILCCRAGHLRQYSFCPPRLEREIRMPEQHCLVIAASGVEADKIGAARDSYNRCSLATRKIFALWRAATKRDDASLGAVLASGASSRERLFQIVCESADAEFPPEVLLKRLAQFVEESAEIIPAASQALSRGDLPAFGELVDRSESLAETHLGNQIPETIELARSARALGALAASAFGAGFGGSVWALVPAARAKEFRDAWAAHYRAKYPHRSDASEFLISGAGPGRIQLHC